MPLLWDVRNRALMEVFLEEIARRLHNYVASARSLVEHTRIAVRETEPVGTPARAQYDERIRVDFADSPESRFVQDLRVFLLHIDAATVIARAQWERDHGWQRHLLIPGSGSSSGATSNVPSRGNLKGGVRRWRRSCADQTPEHEHDLACVHLVERLEAQRWRARRDRRVCTFCSLG